MEQQGDATQTAGVEVGQPDDDSENDPFIFALKY